MFKYKNEAELQAMTEKERDEYAVAKREYETELQNKAIAEAVKKSQEELVKEFETKETSIKAEATKSIEELKEAMKAQGEEMAKLKENKGNKTLKRLADVFKEKYDEAVEEKTSTHGIDKILPSHTSITIETKEVVSTDVMPVNDVNDTVFPEDGAEGVVGTGILRTLYSRLIGFFGPRIPQSRIMELVDVQPLTEATLIAINESWVDNAAVTPECALKPVVKMSFEPQEANADPVAARWHTTTKLRRFFPALVNRMEQKFAELVNIKVPQVVLTAIRSGASAFTPNAALAINENPNNYDAIGAVIASQEALGYYPNAIMLHPIAWRNMKQEKNDEGIYTLSNGQSIQLVDIGLDWGDRTIRYVKDPTLGVDEFVVGDFMETVKVGVDSQLMYMETDGRVDTQATTATTGLARNIRTHVIEKFVAVLIPTGSSAGLVRDTFSNVKTLITAEPTT